MYTHNAISRHIFGFLCVPVFFLQEIPGKECCVTNDLSSRVQQLNIVEKNLGGPSHLHSHSQSTHTIHNEINSQSYNTKGERVEREEERTYCIVFFFYTLAYN